MRLDEIDRPRGIDEVATILLDVDFPVPAASLSGRIGHVMLENRDGELVPARDVLSRTGTPRFVTADEVVVALLEGLGIGVFELQLDVVKPTAGESQPDTGGQAAATGQDQLIDEVLRDDAAAEQGIERDRDAAAAERREQLRGRQRETRYEPPNGPTDPDALDSPRPPTSPEHRRR